MNTDQRNQLDDLAAALTPADRESCCPQLPSAHGVVGIVRDLRDALFPGYHKARRTNAEQQVIETADRLEGVASRLKLEVGRALSSRQGHLRLHESNHHERPADYICSRFLHQLPDIQATLQADVAAAYNGDPAACSPDEIILCYPGFEAVLVHRIAHALHKLGVDYLPRILSEWAHRETGIDIHPAATIGERFFIDHGTGVVVGETCEIGSGVTLYQGVTLGAWSFPRDEQGELIRDQKRHPTLEDNVTVYSNASILGGHTVIGHSSLVGSGVTLSRSVPANTIVTVEKPSLQFREAG